jgi:SLT domain-containing protein
VLGTNKAGGLFQMIPQVFNKWSVSGFNNRFRPLDNSLAVVNAQINARQILNEGGRILSGKSGWTAAGGRNACK